MTFLFFPNYTATFISTPIPVPRNAAPTKLGEESMIPLPSLEVECTPRSLLLCPEGAYPLENVSTVRKNGIGAFKTFIVLFDGLDDSNMSE